MKRDNNENNWYFLNTTPPPPSRYHMKDIWIIANSPSFEVHDRSRDMLIFTLSAYHSPSKSGILQVDFFSGTKETMSSNDGNFWALRGPNVSQPFAIIDNLDSPGLANSALKNLLLGQGSGASEKPFLPLTMTREQLLSIANQYCTTYNLNEDQIK